MKILIYQPRVSYYTGGGEVYPLQNARFFAELGHDVTVLTVRADYIEECEYFTKFCKANPKVKIAYMDLDDNYRDIYAETPGVNWERWDKESVYVARLGYEYMLKNKFDIVTVHCILDTMAVPFDQKYVLHLHGTPTELNYLAKLLLPKQKNQLAVSKNVANGWRELGANPEMRISTNAIDDTVYMPAPDLKKDKDLLFVGRLIPIKGIQYILKALRLLKDKYGLTPTFDVVGKGPYREELESLTHELGLDDQVVFHGLVSPEFLLNAYQTAKVAVLPSYIKEGIMSTLLESAACKLPAITTRGTSMEEFAKNDENALLVNPEDENDLCEKIYKLLTDTEYATALAERAYKEVKSNFTWLAKAKELIGIFEEVI